MKGLVITANSNSELKLLSDLAKKLGFGSTSLSDADLEDIGMSKLLKKVDTSKKASRAEVMRKLST